MNLNDYARTLRQQWYVVFIFAAIALAGAALYTFTETPVYSASTKLFISVSGRGADIADLQSGSTFTQQRVKSYADLIDSPEVLNQVISELNLPYSTDKLADEISAESPLDTVLLNVTVDDTNARRAASIANAFAPVFAKYVAQIETPNDDTASATSPVKVSVTKQADVPMGPVSPRIPVNLALGLLIGLGVGIGIAILRDQLDTAISSISDIEKVTGQIPLGVVPFDKTTSKSPLVQADNQGGRAEAFRTLRTNLQFTNVDEPPRIVVVTSALPNEGKSTTACNIAMTLALSGASVVLVEGDLRKPALGKYLGISSAAGLTNVLAGQNELREVLVSYTHENFAVLPSGPRPPNPSELLGSVHMSNMLNTLKNHFDYVVIDAPPLLPVTDAAVLAAIADGAMLVVRYGQTKMENLDRAVQSLAAVNARLLGTVLNFAPNKTRGGGYDGYGYGYGYGSPQQSTRGGRSDFRSDPLTSIANQTIPENWPNSLYQNQEYPTTDSSTERGWPSVNGGTSEAEKQVREKRGRSSRRRDH